MCPLRVAPACGDDILKLNPRALQKGKLILGKIDFAIVHHANQYIITNGYPNREGLDDVIGSGKPGTGYLEIFEMHRAYGIPFNLHLSGTLLESILWHHPDFLVHLRDLGRQGLLGLVGSSYGQNIMRFFSYQHNFRQLNEEIRLYVEHMGCEPGELKIFWPPERLWDTEQLAPVLTDKGLLNGGYEYVLVDDRLYYPERSGGPTRRDLDQGKKRNFEDFYPCRIVEGKGLTALPISTFLRRNIPPRDKSCLRNVEKILRWLLSHSARAKCPPVAIYGDDLEKSAGCCGWDEKGPAQYEAFLRWLVENPWVRPVRLSEWAAEHCDICMKSLETGSYFEMSRGFGAGEDYEKWYHDPKWNRYRNYYSWSEGRVIDAASKGADPALIETAWKHLLASAWETAWHTPSSGVHGDSRSEEIPSPWSRAIASHSRHSAVIAEAALRMKDRKSKSYVYMADIDNDGHEELIIGNELVLAVFSPRHGGRMINLFFIGGSQGKMVVGNPGDDWNWQEELNKSMETPANHPGALTDIGYADDRYETVVTLSGGGKAEAVFVNSRKSSKAFGLRKMIRLGRGKNEIEVKYQIPQSLTGLSIECGFSPDYLNLLRFGRGPLREYAGLNVRGYSNNGIAVWLRLADPIKTVYDGYTHPRAFGHGHAIKIRVLTSPFTLWIGTGTDEQTMGSSLRTAHFHEQE